MKNKNTKKQDVKAKNQKVIEDDKKQKTHTDRYYQALILVLSVAVLALLVRDMAVKKETPLSGENFFGTTTILSVREITPSDENASILEELRKFPEIEQYMKYPAEIALLTQAEIDKLSATQPAIYKNLEAPIYKVEFKTGEDKGILVLYNNQSKKIVKMFEINILVIA